MLIGSILLNIWYQIGSSQMEDISSLAVFTQIGFTHFFATICDLQ
jgi:hypothetical protein